MSVLTPDMRRVVREQRLGFVATVSPDGTPNLSPKGTVTIWDDDHVVFADIRSPNTIRNLLQNPAVEVNVVDPVVRKGYRFKGTARVLREGELFENALRLYETEFSLSRDRIESIVLIRVESARALISPGYDLGLTEDEIRARWEAHWDSLRRGEGRPPPPRA
jgi:predicted pyridoxine 5'-phosphate oxidase superfamily flavin-nucleotide-binding protein